MGAPARAFLLDGLARRTRKVGAYLLRNMFRSLAEISLALNLPKKEVAVALTSLISLDVVKFVCIPSGTKYYVCDPLGRLADDPVYLKYLAQSSPDLPLNLAARLVVHRRICLPAEAPPGNTGEDTRSALNRMMQEGILRLPATAEPREGNAKRPRQIHGANGQEVELNLNTLRKKIMDKIVSCKVEAQFTKQTAHVLEAVRNCFPAPASFSSILQQSSKFLEINGTGIRAFPITTEKAVAEHLKYLVAYGAVSAAGERYQLNHTWCLKQIRAAALIEYCENYVTEDGGRLLPLLLAREYVEDKFIQRHSLMDASRAKKALFLLLSENIVQIQMVPKTPECLASKSFHLWRSSIDIASRGVRDNVVARIRDIHKNLFETDGDTCGLAEEEQMGREALVATLEHLYHIYFVVRDRD